MGSQWPRKGPDAPAGLEPHPPLTRQGQGVTSWQLGPAEQRKGACLPAGGQPRLCVPMCSPGLETPASVRVPSAVGTVTGTLVRCVLTPTSVDGQDLCWLWRACAVSACTGARNQPCSFSASALEVAGETGGDRRESTLQRALSPGSRGFTSSPLLILLAPLGDGPDRAGVAQALGKCGLEPPTS